MKFLIVTISSSCSLSWLKSSSSVSISLLLVRQFLVNIARSTSWNWMRGCPPGPVFSLMMPPNCWHSVLTASSRSWSSVSWLLSTRTNWRVVVGSRLWSWDAGDSVWENIECLLASDEVILRLGSSEIQRIIRSWMR